VSAQEWIDQAQARLAAPRSMGYLFTVQDDARRALTVLLDVLEIHQPDDWRPPACQACGGFYPCETVRAITGP
jgi:hypothetical protein